MQLFAFNGKKELVSAHYALKQQDYFCAECGGVVRLRGGLHRQKHFYHLKPDAACRQSQKSLVHLQVQYFLQALFPEEEVVLECRFPEIHRIADVVWEPQKLIFEVQCSGISAQEVAARNADYSRRGYQVIWILHDKRFNKWRVTAAEYFLRDSPHYFTNIDAEGRGFIYDQADLFHNGRRRIVKKYFRTSLDSPSFFQNRSPTDNIPSFLQARFRSWPLFFRGDLGHGHHHGVVGAIEAVDSVWNLEQSCGPQKKKRGLVYVKDVFHRFVIRPYLLFFRIFLEKACK